jgi:hypothetical protein
LYLNSPGQCLCKNETKRLNPRPWFECRSGNYIPVIYHRFLVPRYLRQPLTSASLSNPQSR